MAAADGAGMLIRLDTSALEHRFRDLTDTWDGQVRGIRGDLDDCSLNVRSVAADVGAIQRFLLSYHNREMSTVLSQRPTSEGAGGEAATLHSPESLEGFANATGSGTPAENLLAMVAIARRLLAENAALRTSLDSATAALTAHTTTSGDLHREVVVLRQLTTKQSADLKSITEWLGMAQLPLSGANATGAAGGANGGNAAAPGSSGVGAAPSPPSLQNDQTSEAVLSQSPLLLSFRRVLLRDLTERLTSVVNQQSKDFHDSVAHLEGRIQSGHYSVEGGEFRKAGGGGTDELQDSVRTLTKRIKELDQRAVKREEFTALMRTKADSLLLPAKADSAIVSDLERRLTARCVDLEERCAYAEAERDEFRAILRSLIAAQPPPPSLPATTARRADGTALDPAAASSADAAALRQGVTERGALLRDLLPALGGSAAAVTAAGAGTAGRAASKPRASAAMTAASRSNTPPAPAQSLQQQPSYRVDGAGALPPSAAGVGGATADGRRSAGGSASLQRDAARAHASSPPPQPTGGDAVAIGMTASQEAYAGYVSQQLNRRQISSLPALPYERMSNPQ